jgi:molecular chaperone HscB
VRLRRELQRLRNHFELFGLAPAFALDADSLERAYREIQARVHPDRFAQAGDAERRASMQMTTQVNEAYRTLKSPLRRAQYLVEMHGVDTAFETNTAMPREFLMAQMELRERLERELQAQKAALEARLADCIDGRRDWQAASDLVRELMFLEKLDEDVNAAYEALEA